MKNILESEINRFLTHFNKSGNGFGFKNNSQRLHNGTYTEGEAFDYTIMYPSKVYNFDCKETISDTIKINSKEIKQIINLKRIYDLNQDLYRCFFIVYFKKQNQLGYISIDRLFNLIDIKKNIKVEDLTLIKSLDFLRGDLLA